MEEALERFLRYHRTNGLSPKIVTYHRQTISTFASFLKVLGESTELEDLKTDLARQRIEFR